MSDPEREAVELTYPLRTAARLTGISPELIRAWERRYGVVEPARTPGGTRRYSAADLERLRLVKAAVDAGRRIGQVAGLPVEELRALATPDTPPTSAALDAVLQALEQMDGARAQQLISMQLTTLGAARFAREFAVPLIEEVGQRWAESRLSVASEHLATGVLRSTLGAALQPSAASLRGPVVVFATPSGERHELGLLMAALTALGAGANPVYLGPDLPTDEMRAAVERSGAAAIALSVVTLEPARAEPAITTLRGDLAEGVHVLVGGAGSRALALPADVERIERLDELERRVELLAESAPAGARRQPGSA